MLPGRMRWYQDAGCWQHGAARTHEVLRVPVRPVLPGRIMMRRYQDAWVLVAPTCGTVPAAGPLPVLPEPLRPDCIRSLPVPFEPFCGTRAFLWY